MRSVRLAIVVAVVAVTAAACGEDDRGPACERGFGADSPYAHIGPDHRLSTCKREHWSDKRIDCELRSGGGFQTMFCKDVR